ncbi:hypothetical protein EYF80_055445 [Liparis tanakae]|uniref:Uncharacterized protein n=1 Tax=Liparis tanakae TaxID=230148 RepID=A0A4Z2F0B2_9TELE|nr:hypothetical protein EYF80_055445 [Liparis tanakae]
MCRTTSNTGSKLKTMTPLLHNTTQHSFPKGGIPSISTTESSSSTSDDSHQTQGPLIGAPGGG